MKRMAIIALVALVAISCSSDECNCDKYITVKDLNTGQILEQEVFKGYSRKCNSAGSASSVDGNIETRSVISCKTTWEI